MFARSNNLKYFFFSVANNYELWIPLYDSGHITSQWCFVCPFRDAQYANGILFRQALGWTRGHCSIRVNNEDKE